MRMALHANDGNHENSAIDEDNSDNYKQGDECLGKEKTNKHKEFLAGHPLVCVPSVPGTRPICPVICPVCPGDILSL